MTGAQVVAAKNAAAVFLVNGYTKALTMVSTSRHITLDRGNFPTV